jgi:predicted Rossmann fold flavoprotein
MSKRKIIIAGGGAAGFFAAITAAESNPDAEVTILEQSRHPLSKVLASGGGRCNVTHACYDPRELVRFYPRGGKELRGAFHRFQPRDTIEWFQAHGIPLKTESDGRVFPVSDQAGSIAECLLEAARELRVTLRLHESVRSAARNEAGRGWSVVLSTGASLQCDQLLLATGGNPSSKAYGIAQSLGHTITPLVPSLFTFKIVELSLCALAGISVSEARLQVEGARLQSKGPLLITHWGLSGPAVLSLSAWGARELHKMDYRFPLLVDWIPSLTREHATEFLKETRSREARKTVPKAHPPEIPGRLWEWMLLSAGIVAETRWGQLSNPSLRRLAEIMTGMRLEVHGKNPFKEEFVTCGGVSLDEVDFRTMESRIAPGLHFAGEFLDLDGVTGGFNFQAAWTTGYLAGRDMATSDR